MLSCRSSIAARDCLLSPGVLRLRSSRASGTYPSVAFTTYRCTQNRQGHSPRTSSAFCAPELS